MNFGFVLGKVGILLFIPKADGIIDIRFIAPSAARDSSSKSI